MASSKAEPSGRRPAAGEKGLLEGFVEAIADRHSQVDINLNGVTLKIPSTDLGVELNGLLTLTVHMRDLTEDEAKASAARNVATMASRKGSRSP